MSRWFVCLVLGLVVLGFAVWRVDAGVALPAAQAASAPAAVTIENTAKNTEDPQPEAAKDDEDGDSEDAKQDSEEVAEDDSATEEEEDANKNDGDEAPATDKAEADDESGEKDADKEKKTDEKSDDEEEKAKEDEKKSKPYKVERKPLKIEVKLDGFFVADQMEEIALRPEVWTQFKVLKAVEHGTPVKKGEVLVRFDDEKIEEKLSEESIDQRVGELSLMQEEEEFPRVEKLLELKYEQAKTAHEQLVEDFEYYKNTERPNRVLIANYYFNSAKEDLESQREELAQLEKMYAADDLTEETEEIVLRRQKFQVATAELILDLQTASRDYTLDVVLPRYDETYARQLEVSQLKFKQVKTEKEMGLTRGKYELAKKRDARVNSVQRHAKLVSDRALMVLRAPTDGIVYYGRCVKGKWSEVSSLTTKLRPFGTVSRNTVLMTIVKQRPLHVETKLTEKNLPDFKTSLAAVITPGADDKLKLPGKITRIQGIPDAANRFAMFLDVDLSDAPEWLVAGMTCQTTVKVYENKSALVIPTNMVQTDEEDETTKYVMLVDPEEEEPVRRDVKLGRSKNKLVEVLQGLEEGDEIVKEEKKEESSKDG